MNTPIYCKYFHNFQSLAIFILKIIRLYDSSKSTSGFQPDFLSLSEFSFIFMSAAYPNVFYSDMSNTTFILLLPNFSLTIFAIVVCISRFATLYSTNNNWLIIHFQKLFWLLLAMHSTAYTASKNNSDIHILISCS